MPKLRKDIVLAKNLRTDHYIVAVVIACLVLWGIFNLQHTALIDWDEGIFALQGQWLATAGSQGKPFNFQTPPLYQLVIASVFAVVRAQPFVLPFISIIFSCFTIALVFAFTKMLYSSREGLYAVLLFASTEFFLFFSRSGLSEATFLFFFVASVFFFFRGLKHGTTRYFGLCGLLTTAALYTKYSAFPLLVIFFIIGVLTKKTINRKWFILTIIVPILLYAPYVILFLSVIGGSGISARHISLLGIHHLHFLFYLIRFAPFPLLIALLYGVTKHERSTWDFYIIVTVLIFFALLGFYHHYFRLAYPLIPFLAILAARYMRRQKAYVTAIVLVVSLGLSIDTLTYRTTVPDDVGVAVKQLAREERVQYVYASVPPNIAFYIGGEIAIPQTHPWNAVGKKFPSLVRPRQVLYPDSNALQTEDKTLIVYATAYESLDAKSARLLEYCVMVQSTEFVDAPVYYKDIFNPQRDRPQLYKIYLAERNVIGDVFDQFWQLGFTGRFTVMLMKQNSGNYSPP